jgi:alkanesulfonate monooxygenase SsuD/methylene tetrahydromethanopterin reductase-like flavin-dependent oxidoreductase (luciferase family)
MRRVATLADGWMTVTLFPGALDTMRAELERHLAEAGRDAASFPIMAYHNVNVGADRAGCLAESKKFLDAYYGPIFTEEMVAAWVAAGTPQECVEHLRNLAAQGAGRITLRMTSWDQEGQYRRLVDEVLPAL